MADCSFKKISFTIRLIIILAAIVILFWQIYDGMVRYLKKETTGIQTVRLTGDNTFLAFTICPDYEAAYKNNILQQYGTNRHIYNTGIYGVNVSVSAKEVHKEVTYELSEIVKKLTLVTKSQKFPKIDVNAGKIDPKYGKWVKIFHTLYGACFSYEMSKSLAQKGITRVETETFMDIYIFLHHPGQFLDYNSMTKLHGVKGVLTFIDITYSLTTNTLENNSALPCSSQMDFHFDTCLQETSTNLIYKEFGCTTPYVESKYPICDRNDEALIMNIRRAHYKYMGPGQKDVCTRPCTNMSVLVGIPTSSNTSEVETAVVKVSLKSKSKVTKLVLNLPFISVIADIGGYSGLLLGISLVDLTSVMKYFTSSK